jgi:hypothetical protein
MNIEGKILSFLVTEFLTLSETSHMTEYKLYEETVYDYACALYCMCLCYDVLKPQQ